MKNLKLLRTFTVPVLLAAMLLFVVILPVGAWVEDNEGSISKVGPQTHPAVYQLLIPGTDIPISFEGAGATGSGSPDIEVSSDGTFVAVAYFKIANSTSDIYLKSSTATDGWLKSKRLGSGSNPHLAFSNNNTVYVVWLSKNKKAVQYSRCTLAAATIPACTSGNVFISNTTLDDPDIMVDNSGNIHVVWENDGNIESARSTDNGQNWFNLSTIPAPTGFDFKTPILAFSNNVLHLAFVSKDNSNFGQAIEYRRADDLALHNWGGAQSFSRQGATPKVFSGYNDLDNPTLAASGNDVYLAWEAHSGNNNNNNNNFGLMRITSADNGVTWPGDPLHITSNFSGRTLQDADKLSRSQETGQVVPIQEEGLRPSLAISSTSFAIVWQQRPGAGCGESGNSSSEIYFAYNPPTWITDTVADNSNEYSIDPDLAVGPGAVEHFVFMKDKQTLSCEGGDGSEYGLYYRGPFTITVNDEGEEEPSVDPDPPPPGGNPLIFLPLVLK